ncbi:MAG: hypothetical protein Q8S11_10695 [Daejeonella sp.]|uniref:hypothetical protein n=1 Tax=Daejeonella sp. TaxID=2805397 RepID=UPI002734935D|nr:hypothetical protein [Daejeonella sp.]MDP3468793.1 hypothetical protein [Daejeonella sp.]
MHPISDKELDKLFQQRFGDLEIEPSAAVWEKITGTMDQKRRKSAFPSFWMAAASIVVLISVGFWYFRPQEVIKLQGRSEIAQIMEDSSRTELKGPALSTKEPLSSSQTVKTVLSDFSLANASGINSNDYSLIEKTPTAEPEITFAASPEPVVIASEPVKKVSQVQPKKVVKVPTRYSGDQSALDVTQADMMAITDFSVDEINPDESEVRSQRKIRSIGSLVNFVIAKVDKREDKLIEFKDSDEGSEVSGINLGLVKIKSRK